MTRNIRLWLGPLLILTGSHLHAQSSEIWRNGNWIAQAPPAGKCGSLPLVEIKGPGSIFDSVNQSAFKSLEAALPEALTKPCPGVSEAIVVSGRSRRLMKVGIPSIAAAPPAPATQSSAPPAPANANSAATPAQPLAPIPQRLTIAPGNLPALAGAAKATDKCEVLLKWLDSGKTGTDRAAAGYRIPEEMMVVFRDEPMTAVFGLPWDQTENRWRSEQYTKVVSGCLGTGRPPQTVHTVFGEIGGGAARALEQFPRLFQPYRSLLDEAFLGERGQFEPAEITRYLQRVRSQISWANQAMGSAAIAAPSMESFQQLMALNQRRDNEMSLLGDKERRQVDLYLTQREKDIAPAIAGAWLLQKAEAPKTLASAKALYTDRNKMTPIIRALNTEANADWSAASMRLIESLIADPLRKDLDEFKATPATLDGASRLASMQSQFDSNYASLKGVPAVDSARDELAQLRLRILTATLQTWRGDLERVPLQAPAVAAKHQQMEALFPTRQDRELPIYHQYQDPMKSKEDQLRSVIAAALTQPASAGQPAANSSSLTPDSLVVRGLRNRDALRALYIGDFVNMTFDREDTAFSTFLQTYMEAYGTQCAASLPANKVEMTRQVCVAWTETRNGYGTLIRTTCNGYRTEGTGIFADPALYDVKRSLDRQTLADAGRVISNTMTQITQGGLRFVGDVLIARSDAESLVRNNSCAGPALMRFQENLRLFAMNRQPVRLGSQGSPSSVLIPIPGIPFQDQDYRRLIADLVADDATKWGAFARLIPNSISGASVSSRDKLGRPEEIVSSYGWESLLGKQNGGVSLTFSDGQPECLVYSETGVCHTPNRKIVAAYLDGAYAPR
jgi:hypothetical protein